MCFKKYIVSDLYIIFLNLNKRCLKYIYIYINVVVFKCFQLDCFV